MRLPDPLQARLEKTLGTTIQDVQPCFGGDINDAARIRISGETLFVKWNTRDMFSVEAKGLQYLRQPDVLRVPEVIASGAPEDNSPAFLVLEWLETGRRNPDTFARLGEGLAQLHLNQAEKHGLDHDNYIGSLPQYNRQLTSWAEFYAEQRIRPQMEIARQRGRLPAPRENNLNRLIDKFPGLLPNDNPAASLLHGDLWSGNVMSLQDGTTAIIDPAVYYGHREVEIAFTQLFGGFGSTFIDAYNSVYPLGNGYTRRKSLYQLYPLMVHMNLFGGGYISQVDAIVRSYL